MWGKLIILTILISSAIGAILINSGHQSEAQIILANNQNAPLPGMPVDDNLPPEENPIVYKLSTEEKVEQEIIWQAMERRTVDIDLALAIAECESNLNPLAKNPHSTAKGVYQFLDGTWKNYCEGDVYDYEANIKCFMQNFNRHKSWWQQCLNQIN